MHAVHMGQLPFVGLDDQSPPPLQPPESPPDELLLSLLQGDDDRLPQSRVSAAGAV